MARKCFPNFPYGEQLAGRNTQSDYRYAFQGQELDKETGMEAFQLRLWDGRIGRWLSTDPYGLLPLMTVNKKHKVKKE
jgi:RHS repeat-associated protein